MSKIKFIVFCLPIYFLFCFLVGNIVCNAWLAWGTDRWGDSKYANHALTKAILAAVCLWAASSLAEFLGLPLGDQVRVRFFLVVFPVGFLAGLLYAAKHSGTDPD